MIRINSQTNGINRKKASSWIFLFLTVALLSGTGLFPSGIRIAGAEEATAESTPQVVEEPVTETTTEEVYHMPTYEQEPQSNSYEAWPEGPLVEGSGAIVMDLETSAILYEKNIDVPYYPASITKMMTGLIACEQLDPAASFTMSESAAYGIEPGSSTIYGDVNEVFTVEQALMGLMLESANEMALALAEQCSGTVKKFVELMNQRARELGCTHTHFNNPNGLPDETHYTTARDMALICQACWQNATFRRYFTTDVYNIPPTNVMKDTRYLLNHHKMMPGKDYAYDGVLGGKTGYTQAAGNTLVTFAKRDKLNLVVVVLGSMNGAYPDTTALLDYAFGNFEHLNMKVDQEPKIDILPAERYLLAEEGNVSAFPFRKRVIVTVPSGTKRDQITSETTLLQNQVGLDRLVTSYSYYHHVVGYGMQYEEPILRILSGNSTP